MMRWQRVGLISGVAVVAAGAVLALAMPRALIVDAAVVDRGPIVAALDEDGRTRVVGRALVSAPTAGTLVKPVVVVGDRVQFGDVLARLEPLPLPLQDAAARAQTDAAIRAADAAVVQARATLARMDAMSQSAGENLQRAQKLADQGGVARVQVDDEAARVHVASHDVDAARSAVRVAMQQAALQRALRGRVAGTGDLLELTSPIDGVVLSVPHEHGGVVMQGTPIVELGDPRFIDVIVPLRTAEALSLPASARVVISGWGGADIKGTVRAVEPKAFTRVSALGVEEQRTNVIIDLDEPPPTPALGDGFGVHVSIVIAEVHDVARVPIGALIRRGDAWAVLVMVDGTAVERLVVVGRRASGLAEVKQGLVPGDVVVLYPGDRVVAGDRIRARD